MTWLSCWNIEGTVINLLESLGSQWPRSRLCFSNSKHDTLNIVNETSDNFQSVLPLLHSTYYIIRLSVFVPEPDQCISATLCEEKNRKLNLKKLLLPSGLCEAIRLDSHQIRCCGENAALPIHFNEDSLLGLRWSWLQGAPKLKAASCEKLKLKLSQLLETRSSMSHCSGQSHNNWHT